MKKALSILLSVMMVAGLFIALVPTASAAELYVVDEVELGETLYFNDFEDVDGSLEGDDLLAELGWYLSSNTDANGDGYGDTKYDYSSLRNANGDPIADVLVSENCYDGSQAITIMSTAAVAGGNGGTWETLTFLGDERLAGGDYVIEFDFMALSSHIEADNSPDFLGTGASGASAGPISVAKYNTGTKAGTYWHYGIKSRGQTDIHCSYPGGVNAGKAYGGADYATTDLGGESMYAITTALGATIRFRIVIDSTYGLSAWASYDEGSTWTQTDGMTAANATEFAKNAKYLGKEIKWRNTTNFDVAIDNLGIYTIAGKEKTGSKLLVDCENPYLVISEVSTEAKSSYSADVVWTPEEGSDIATAIGGKGNTYAVDANGNYLVPEEGQGDGTKENVRFEYLEIYNSGNTTVDLSDYSIATFSMSVAASNAIVTNIKTISGYSRIHKGLKVVTDSADGITWQFYNDPEDCILAPGEAAILFMPNNLFYSSPANGHVNAFKKLLLQDYCGLSAQDVEDMKILTLYDNLDEQKEDHPGFNPANGMGINGSGNSIFGIFKDNADGSVPFTPNTETLAELNEAGSLVSYIFDSQLGAGAGTLIGDMIAGDSRDGYKTTQYHGSQYTYWDEDGNFIPGGKLDTTRLPQAVNTANWTFGYVPEDLKNPNKLDPELAPVAFDGKFQTTELVDDEYGLRLIADANDLTGITAVAFVISVNGGAEKAVYVNYVYDSISTDNGMAAYTNPNGKVIALVINGCPVAASFSVKLATVATDTTVTTGTAYAIAYGA